MARQTFQSIGNQWLVRRILHLGDSLIDGTARRTNNGKYAMLRRLIDNRLVRVHTYTYLHLKSKRFNEYLAHTHRICWHASGACLASASPTPYSEFPTTDQWKLRAKLGWWVGDISKRWEMIGRSGGEQLVCRYCVASWTGRYLSASQSIYLRGIFLSNSLVN